MRSLWAALSRVFQVSSRHCIASLSRTLPLLLCLDSRSVSLRSESRATRSRLLVAWLLHVLLPSLSGHAWLHLTRLRLRTRRRVGLLLAHASSVASHRHLASIVRVYLQAFWSLQGHARAARGVLKLRLNMGRHLSLHLNAVKRLHVGVHGVLNCRHRLAWSSCGLVRHHWRLSTWWHCSLH